MISSSDTFHGVQKTSLWSNHFHMTLFLCRRCLCPVLGCCVSLSCSPPASGCYTLPRPGSATSTRLMHTPPGKQLCLNSLIQPYSWRFASKICACFCLPTVYVYFCTIGNPAWLCIPYFFDQTPWLQFFFSTCFCTIRGWRLFLSSKVLYISGVCTQMVGSPPPLAGPLAENCDADQMAEITTQRGLSTLTSSGKSILYLRSEN